MDKTIRRATREEQLAETYRYWQSLSVGDRFSAVWDATVAAYAFKGVRLDDRLYAERIITRITLTQKRNS